MKSIKQLRAKKGFTLVEVMVAITIFAMMAAIVAQILAITIKRYADNDRVDKNLDSQIESLVRKNGTSERGTFDLTLSFLNGGSTDTLSINDISVISNYNDSDGSFELNTMTADIPQANGGNGGGGSFEPGDGENGGGINVGESLMKAAGCHVYGSSGLQHVTVAQVGNPVIGENDVTITLSVTASSPAPDYVFSNSWAESIKIAMPSGAKVTAITLDNYTTVHVLGQTIRFSAKSTKDNQATHTATFSMNIPKQIYESVYVSFANYFIEKDSTSTATSANLKDSETPGLYNKQ